MLDSLLTSVLVSAALAAGGELDVDRPAAVARVRSGEQVAVLDRPRGPVVGRIGDRTQFGSRTALAVLERRGGWLAVSSTERRNRTVWIRDSSRIATSRATHSIAVDLSERRLELRHGGRVVRRVRVGTGSRESPTPTGRFSVTDRLDGRRFGSLYGCCILALSGYQPRTPPGWPGGDRLAIHGTAAPSSVGTRSSAGCLRAHERDLRALMREVPLGTLVEIRE